MVQFSDELGSGSLSSVEDIEAYFSHRVRSRQFNETWFYYSNEDEDYPAIAMLSAPQFAHLTYFETPVGPLYTSRATEASEVASLTFRVHGELTILSGDFIIPLVLAEAALEEFVRSPDRPNCLQWTDPSAKVLSEERVARRSMQSRQRRPET